MGERHKNFEDPISWTRDIRREKKVFSESPFAIKRKLSKYYILHLPILVKLILRFFSILPTTGKG
jgi:hypothetical protein